MRKHDTLELCSYCQGGPKIYESKNSLTVDQVYNTIRVMNYPNYSEPTCIYVRLNYCPMCGLELRHERVNN